MKRRFYAFQRQTHDSHVVNSWQETISMRFIFGWFSLDGSAICPSLKIKFARSQIDRALPTSSVSGCTVDLITDQCSSWHYRKLINIRPEIRRGTSVSRISVTPEIPLISTNTGDVSEFYSLLDAIAKRSWRNFMVFSKVCRHFLWYRPSAFRETEGSLNAI